MLALASVLSSSYRDELVRSMEWLGAKADTIFIGQAVKVSGTSMSGTLPVTDQAIEFPVAEEFQMGASIGLALAGFVPVSIYPRWPFLLLATNQLVNHLDKLSIYSHGGYQPKVIIRTAVPSRTPLDPQSQHLGNYSDPFRQMLKTVEVIECERANQIFDAYQRAYERDDGRSTLIVEHTQRYA